MRAAAANNDTEFNLVPAPFPGLNKVEVSKFGSKESRFNAMINAFITTACNNIELAMRFFGLWLFRRRTYAFKLRY